MKDVQFILYVRNQTRSKKFYGGLFHLKPIMDVPGMTEFQLTDSVKLGLMPEKGIAKILTLQLHTRKKAMESPDVNCIFL